MNLNSALSEEPDLYAQTHDADFSKFSDWVSENFDIDLLTGNAEDLTDGQSRIIANNKALLSDPDAFRDHVEEFENELAKISLQEQAYVRSRFTIRLDHEHIDCGADGFDASGLRFPVYVRFSHCVFHGGAANFGHTVFEYGATFENVEFNETAMFANAEFLAGSVSFDETRFHGHAQFTRTQFLSPYVVFEQAEFLATSSFKAANFGGKAEPNNPNEVSFEDTEFHGNTHFQETRFFAKVSFDRAAFLGREAEFRKAFFQENARFETVATAEGVLDFIDAKFAKQCDFSFFESGNYSRVQFSRCNFGGIANFELGPCKLALFTGSTFESIVRIDAKLEKAIPNLLNTKFDRLPDLSGIDTPHSIGDISDHNDLVKIARRLKSLATDGGDHEAAGRYFALEMAAKCKYELKQSPSFVLSWIYGVVSNYGQSYWRPLIGLAVIWLSSFLMYTGAISGVCARCSSEWTSAQLATRNLIPFLGSAFRYAPEPNVHAYYSEFQLSLNEISRNLGHGGFEIFYIIGFVEQVLGAVFFFLLILGMRNVFRMK